MKNPTETVKAIEVLIDMKLEQRLELIFGERRITPGVRGFLQREQVELARSTLLRLLEEE